MRRRSAELLDGVDTILALWGAWARQQPVSLGYPGNSADDGIGEGRAPRRSGIRPEPEHALEWCVEEGIRELPRELREVVIAEYVGRGTVTQKARDLHLSRQRYYELRESAIYAVYMACRVGQVFRNALNALGGQDRESVLYSR